MRSALALSWIAILALAARAESESRGVVHIVGVTHAPAQLRSPRMSPGHVRAALARLEPDVIAVESNPEWFAAAHFYRQTWEAQGIAVPTARARNLPVYGIDWIGDSSGHWAERQRIARCHAERDRLAGAPEPEDYAYGASRSDQLQVVAAASTADFLRLNGPEFGAQRIAWLDARREEAGTPQAYIAERDGHIAEHIAAVVARHPDARVVVVIGAAHKANLERLLTARGITVGDLESLAEAVDLADCEAMDEWLAPSDLVAVLVAAYDSLDGITIPDERRERLWSRLERAASEASSAALVTQRSYLAGRRAILAGEMGEARRAFAALAQSDSSTPFPHTGSVWRWHLDVEQAARLELGRLADLRGDRAAAREHYRMLLDDLPDPNFSEDYHSAFEFQARARNAIRALLDRPYQHDFAQQQRRATPILASPAVSPEEKAAARAKLERAWDHWRSKKWQELGTLADELVDAPGLVKMERLEAELFQAEAAWGAGDRELARKELQDLEAKMSGIAEEHWLRKSIANLSRKLDG